MAEVCPCGSGLPQERCCQLKYPSIAWDLQSAASLDFGVRWSVNRQMLWRAIIKHAGPPPRLPGARTVVILGAGSCRDLPMDFLCSTFDQVVLVDKNRSSLDSSAEHIPPGLAPRVVRVCWDVSGPFGEAADALVGEVRAGGITLEQAAGCMERLCAAEPDGEWLPSALPPELASRAPFGLVISDLILTQLSLNCVFQCALALGRPLREVYEGHRAAVAAISRACSRNHQILLRLLAGPESKVIVLNDTFMLGRDFDGSASLFNLIAAQRGKDASDSSWIAERDIDGWLAEYSLLGGDLGGIGPETPLGGALKLLGRTWWWWPHCAVRSYLVVCYVFGATVPPSAG